MPAQQEVELAPPVFGSCCMQTMLLTDDPGASPKSYEILVAPERYVWGACGGDGDVWDGSGVGKRAVGQR